MTDQATTQSPPIAAPINHPGGSATAAATQNRVANAMAAVAAARSAAPAKAEPPSAATPPAPGSDRDEDDGPTFDSPATPRGRDEAGRFASLEADDDDGPTFGAEPDEEPEEKVSAIIRAREKAQRIRREAEAQRRELEGERARLEARRRELERFERAAQAKSPAEALRAMGLEPRAVLEDAALEGTPEHELRQMRARLEAQERQWEEYQRSQQQAAQRAAVVEAEEKFTKIASDEERFPYLAARAQLHPALVKRQAYALQEAYFEKTGQYPTIEMIADGLDHLERESYRAIHEREARRGTSTSRDSGQAPAADKRRAPSKTLSSQRSGERSVAEPDPRTLTREQRARIAAEKLRRYRAAQGK